MSATRFMSMLLCLTVASTVVAQEAGVQETTPPKAPPEPVMMHVPAEAMGYIVMNNVQPSMTHVEEFLRQIGVAPMMNLDEMPGGLVGMIQMQAMLGEGFNSSGGFAVVMLDPQAYGVDLVEMMGLTAPTTEPAQTAEQKLPLVVLVPGDGVQEVFGNYTIEEGEGGLSVVNLRMGAMFAASKGGYVALSPSDAALKAMLAAEAGGATKQLSASQADLLAKSDIFMHLNMKIAGPIYTRIIRAMTEQMEQMAETGTGSPEAMAELMAAYMPMYSELVSQIDAVSVSGRFASDGLVLSEIVAVNSQSLFGKIMAATTPPPAGQLLNKLPSLPYVLALGGGGTTTEEAAAEGRKWSMDMVEKMLNSDALSEIPAETKTKLRSLVERLDEQIDNFQLVIGGAPEGSGVFGVACVMQCKDSEVVRQMVADKASVAEELIKALLKGKPDADVESLKIVYTREGETLDDLAVDVVDVTHDELTTMSDEDREEFIKVMGEDRLRFRVAALDAHTVVATFGGSQAMLAKAVESARSGGPIMDSPGLDQAMAHMPSNRVGVMLINVSNLMQVIATGGRIMGEESAVPQFTTATPIAFGASLHGTEMEMTFFVPNALVKEFVETFMGMAAPPQQEPAQDEDF